MGGDHGNYINTTDSRFHLDLNFTLIIIVPPTAVREAKDGISAPQLKGLFGNRVGWGNKLGKHEGKRIF